MRQIVLDTETTGLYTEEGHRIIEIGCLELINRKITGKQYHQYINPERPIDEAALKIHGITNQFLDKKPYFADIVHELIPFINGAELIIHNAPFDIGFLNYELKLINHPWKLVTDHCRVVDTLLLARQLHTGQRNSLDALCKRYQVDNSGREFHGALLDAYLLAQVYLNMTGGQGSLFDELKLTEVQISENALHTTGSISTPIIPVMKANQDELIQHNEHLRKMAEKGKCLWLEEDTPLS